MVENLQLVIISKYEVAAGKTVAMQKFWRYGPISV